MDITQCCVSSRGMLRQAIAAFLWVSLLSGLSSVTEKLLYWVEIRWLSHSLLWETLRLPLLFALDIHLRCEALSFAVFGWIWAESIALSTSQFIASSISSHFIYKHQWPGSTGSHTCLIDDVLYFGSGAVSLLFHNFLFPSFWWKFIMVSFVQIIFSGLSRLF